MADGAIPPPPDLSSVGEKVYRACVGRDQAQMSSVRASMCRRIPYAMWLDSNRDINTEAGVVGWYYNDLRGLQIKGASRTKRSLAPLFHTYVGRFNPVDPDFVKLADNLRGLAQRCTQEGIATMRLADLHTRFGFFEPRLVGQTVAAVVLSSPQRGGVDGWFESVGLWPGFKTSALGLHVFAAALQLPATTFRSGEAIAVLMEWTRSISKDAIPATLKAQVANALLKPWLSQEPPDQIKRIVGDFCIQTLGDPRFDGFTWSGVDADAKALLLRWLTGRTLEIFFDVLRATADNIWEHRQRFWTSYYRSGFVTEAWAVLGPDAKRHIQHAYRGSTTDLTFGLLSGQYDEGQSVLLMRLGDLIFCEWSHNGRLRVAAIGSPEAPSMYRKYYDAEDLRFESMVFVGHNRVAHQGLPHLHSENRWWQTTAALFIQKKLGIRP